MITIYGMNTCPDCVYVEDQVKGDERYEVVDIGAHVRNLKTFLRLRDASPAFDAAKRVGAVGIPCFVLEDGRVTLRPKRQDCAHGPRMTKALRAVWMEGAVSVMPFCPFCPQTAATASGRSDCLFFINSL